MKVTDRLVPGIVPVHAVVCAYLHPHADTLTGTRIIDTDPPVTVYIAQGCTPAIHNENLQAADASTVLPIVQQILNR